MPTDCWQNAEYAFKNLQENILKKFSLWNINYTIKLKQKSHIKVAILQTFDDLVRLRPNRAMFFMEEVSASINACSNPDLNIIVFLLKRI